MALWWTPTRLGQTVLGTCTDNAGNVSTATAVTVRLDKTAPTISSNLSSLGTKNANGWYNESVTVGFTCTDGLSGVASCTPATTPW